MPYDHQQAALRTKNQGRPAAFGMAATRAAFACLTALPVLQHGAVVDTDFEWLYWLVKAKKVCLRKQTNLVAAHLRFLRHSQHLICSQLQGLHGKKNMRALVDPSAALHSGGPKQQTNSRQHKMSQKERSSKHLIFVCWVSCSQNEETVMMLMMTMITIARLAVQVPIRTRTRRALNGLLSMQALCLFLNP